MTLLQLADGTVMLYDCNVTDENEETVIDYVAEQIGFGSPIDIFVCSHRDADHMRGIKSVHEWFPIQRVWDSGVTGSSPECSEYCDYMDCRREVGCHTVRPGTRRDFGNTRVRMMNATSAELPDNPNAQSIVLRVEHRDLQLDDALSSVMLLGDTDAKTWKALRRRYSDAALSCDILLASHHGSLSFFDDPSEDQFYYTDHLKAMSPSMTVISVGPNRHGHPEPKALEFYERYSTGSNRRRKICRTDHHGTIRLELKDAGGWSLKRDQ